MRKAYPNFAWNEVQIPCKSMSDKNKADISRWFKHGNNKCQEFSTDIQNVFRKGVIPDFLDSNCINKIIENISLGFFPLIFVILMRMSVHRYIFYKDWK